MSFCIFIASSTTTTSPSRTRSPVLTLTLTTMPCIGAWMAPSPPARCAAVVPDVAGIAAVAGAAPSPRMRTRYGSPSASTATPRPAALVRAGRPRALAGSWGGGWLAEQALDVVAEGLLDVLVAFLAQRVGQRLVGRDPVDRRRHRRITQLLAHQEEFLQQAVVAVDGIAFSEVADQDRQHRRRQLVLQDEDVVAEGDRVLELEIFVVNLIEAPARLADHIEVEAGIVRPVAEAGDHGL